MTVSVVSRVGFVSVVAVLMTFVPFIASAENQCGFSRTLDQGVTGEDVRCLQAFLNESGFTVSADGPGSPGNETSRFGIMTEAAVTRWQEAKGIEGANGVFGPASQAAYLLDRAMALEAVLADQDSFALAAPQPLATLPVAQVAGVSDMSVEARFVAAVEIIEEADDEVAHRIITDQSYKNELRDLNKAKRVFMTAALAYFTGDTAGAVVELNEATDYAQRVVDDASPARDEDEDEDEKDEDEDEDKDDEDFDKKELRDDIEDEWDDYSKVSQDYKDLDDDDDIRDDVKDLLKDASKYLTDAEDAYDDKDYQDIESLLKKADNEIDEALDLMRGN